MKKRQSIYILFTLSAMFFTACGQGDYLSPDFGDESLLPQTDDYLSKDYGTQALANELQGTYDAEIGLIFYDEETRTKPVLYLTRGNTELHLKALKNGAIELSYTNFQTEVMPLKMNFSTIGLLHTNADTLFIRGSDGKVRTERGDDMPIGTPLPESDEAELEGMYFRETNKLSLFIDFMMPLPVKAVVRAEKQ